MKTDIGIVAPTVAVWRPHLSPSDGGATMNICIHNPTTCPRYHRELMTTLRWLPPNRTPLSNKGQMSPLVNTGLKLENYYFFTFTFSRPEVRKLLLFYVFTFSRPEVRKLLLFYVFTFSRPEVRKLLLFYVFTFSRPEVRKLFRIYVFTFSWPEVGKLFHISMA